MPRSWQSSQVVFAALFHFTIFNKATSASKVIPIHLFYHNDLFIRICNFTGNNYQEREELYWYKNGEGPHLTITLQLGLVTLSQTQGILSSVSQYCYKVHVYKMFSDCLYKELPEKCQVLFLYNLHQFERRKNKEKKRSKKKKQVCLWIVMNMVVLVNNW